MELVLARSVAAFIAVEERATPVFFDRGIPECLGWARVPGVGVQAHHRRAAERLRCHRIVS